MQDVILSAASILTIGIVTCVFCIWLLHKHLQHRWLFLIVIPPAFSFVCLWVLSRYFGFGEGHILFRLSAAGDHMKAAHGDAAHFILAYPMEFSVLFAAVISVVFSLFIIPKKGSALRVGQGGQMVPQPQVPDTFELPVIRGELEKMQGDLSITRNYFRTLRLSFNLKFQLEIFDLLERRYQVGTKWTESQAKHIEAQILMKLADARLRNIKQEKELEELTVKRKIAEEQQKINNLQKTPESEIEEHKKREELRAGKRRISKEIRNREAKRETIEKAFRETKTKNDIKEKANSLRAKTWEKWNNGEINDKQREKELEDIAGQEQYAIDSI